MAPKRHRARLRPKIRTRRRSALKLAAGLTLACASAALFASAAPWRRLNLPAGGALPRWAAVDSFSVAELPEPLREPILAAAGWEPGQRWGPLRAWRLQSRIASALPCLERVSVRRSWPGRSARVTASLRPAAARVARAARRVGFLGSDGAVFDAPAGSYEESALPAIELGEHPAEADLAPLARLLGLASGPGALRAPIAELRYEGRAAGWSGLLADGTRLEWGELDRPEQKLSRLEEALADAAPRFGPGLTADLRNFEDGKILIRPGGAR